MPSVLPALLVATLLTTSSYAQLSTPAEPEPTSATVHFYQSRLYGFLYPKLQVYADGKMVCKLGRNSQCRVSLPAGTTTFTARIPVFSLGKPVPLPLPLEAGKEYYLEGGFATESAVPGLSYGLTEVVANASKRAQIARARPTPAVTSVAP